MGIQKQTQGGRKMTGVVFNIQRFSVHDGPGIRTTVFLKGCPLRCLWCHNPEGLSRETDIEYIPVKCIGCGRCAAVCPNECHRIENGVHIFERTGCTKCGACAEACVASAMSVSGHEYTVDDVMKKVLSDKLFYSESGGGMTLSGGEPLGQIEFATALLSAARKHGIHTAIETCGYYPEAVLRRALPLVDLVLFDYKVTGEDEHIAATGVSQDLILSNLQIICEFGTPVHLRCPIIPSVNDRTDHYDAIARIAEEYGAIVRVDLEPYHDLGASKYRNIGIEPRFSAKTPSADDMAEILDYIQKKTSKKVVIS